MHACHAEYCIYTQQKAPYRFPIQSGRDLLSIFDPGNYGLQKLRTSERIALLSRKLNTAAERWQGAPSDPGIIRELAASILCLERLYARIRLQIDRVSMIDWRTIPSQENNHTSLMLRQKALKASHAAWHTENTPETQQALAEAVSGMENATTWIKGEMQAHPAFAPKDPRIITTTRQLEAFCKRASEAPYVCVDTEFMSMDTYNTVVQTVQLAISPEDAVLVDMQSPNLDTAPLASLMQNPAIMKVFHAAGQDITLLAGLGLSPSPCFDTQVAANLCGYGFSLGYAAMAEKILGFKPSKEQQMSDWAVRPFSPDQVAYALGDVTHLCPMYQHLHDALKTQEKLATAIRKSMPQAPGKQCFDTLPALDSRNRKSPFKRLLYWRQKEARRLNVPKKHILQDDLIEKIARILPQTTKGMAAISQLPKGFAEGRMGQEILALLKMSPEMRTAFLTPPPPRSQPPVPCPD
ncbi:MAG: hypothetical protein A2018_04890 [Alphaproteobacteria bacterium GWF2_58_20]|nr:MAG: hypothetical protein A2018_04890 [Alphaproteobacteria bacterium GWF2_58_20]